MTTIVYRLLGPASLVCIYVSMSVCLSVCTFVHLFSVSMIVLSTVVSCSIGGLGQLWWVFLSGSLPTVACNLTLILLWNVGWLIKYLSIYLQNVYLRNLFQANNNCFVSDLEQIKYLLAWVGFCCKLYEIAVFCYTCYITSICALIL